MHVATDLTTLWIRVFNHLYEVQHFIICTQFYCMHIAMLFVAIDFPVAVVYIFMLLYARVLYHSINCSFVYYNIYRNEISL